MGKQQGPSVEELEFIFGLFARGIQDPREILDEMQGTELPLRNPRFIRDRKRHFDAAKKVLQIQLEKEVDPVIAKRRTEHFDYLADIAAEFVSGLGTLQEEGDPSDPSKYKIWDVEAGFPMTKEQLSSHLESHVEMTSQQPDGYFDLSLLGSHLKGEPDMSEGPGQAIRDNPVKVVETLKILARSKTFKGTCAVCEDW